MVAMPAVLLSNANKLIRFPPPIPMDVVDLLSWAAMDDTALLTCPHCFENVFSTADSVE